MGDNQGRSGSRYVRDNARLKRTTVPVCHWCWKPIDLALKHPNPMSWSADHVVPLAMGGPIHGARVPMHLRCNQVRGIQPLPPLPTSTTTEDW